MPRTEVQTPGDISWSPEMGKEKGRRSDGQGEGEGCTNEAAFCVVKAYRCLNPYRPTRNTIDECKGKIGDAQTAVPLTLAELLANHGR